MALGLNFKPHCYYCPQLQIKYYILNRISNIFPNRKMAQLTWVVSIVTLIGNEPITGKVNMEFIIDTKLLEYLLIQVYRCSDSMTSGNLVGWYTRCLTLQFHRFGFLA